MKIQIHSKILAIAAAAMIAMATSASAALAHGGGGFGGGHMGGGFRGGPYVGGAISMPPIFNPSVGYTVCRRRPRHRSRRQVPDQYFTKKTVP
jgi:hypothetical protein